MEQQAIAGLKRQWKGIQALSEVLDSLRIEERSGVDLGNLAVKELERYAALAEKSKEEMRTIKDEHAAAVERLEDSVRAQKDEIRELQHQHALEVHKLQTEVTEMKHKHEVTLHQVQAHQSAAEGLQQRLAEQQQHYQRGHAQMQGELQALAAKCEALSRERDSAQQRCAQMEHQMLHFQQQQQQQQQHHGSQPVGRNAQGHNLSGANGTGGQVLQQQQHTAHDESGRMEILMLLPPKMWNVEQVAEWVTLQSVDSGLRQYAAVFAQNQIDGDLLLEMDGGILMASRIFEAELCA
eukprot:INCI18838.2.p1 GENE.INCI18838.2~~INCI18838.2.p1  ORF type:complete len:295 (+),score=87.47 INCI18838.2:230-1114(+)